MLINTVQGQECRIAIVDNGQLEELYVERVSSASHVGNIYKGRITNVEPSIQAAFVDFGLSKNGFLHISDVNPSYFPKNKGRGQQESVGRKKGHRDRPPIQDCLRRGQEVIVQLTKEGIGTKGPTMTTYISVPGRLLVMMPGMSRLGVSRKIDDDGARDKARAILAELNPPEDMGFIVRTAAIDRPKKEFQRDLNYLLRLWKNVRHRINNSKSPAEIYQESDLVTRTIRDVYNANIGRIICDSQDVAAKAKEFLDVAMPRTQHNIELYTGKQGLFHDVGLEDEIEKIYARRIELPSGGSLVFDQAEALVAIDVNSGRFREHSDAETTATKMNVEAAREIARQLRLRDLGGVVIIDFIDMREEKNRRTVERVLRDEMKTDRAKSKVLRISAFGIIEMTRQRVRPSLKHSIFRTCGHCEGIGLIKSEESQSLLVMRNLQRACTNDQVAVIEVSVTPTVANHLSNFERRRILELEASYNKKIMLKGDPALSGNQLLIVCTNTRGSQVAWDQPLKPATERTKVETLPLATVLPPAAPVSDGEDFFDEDGDWMGGQPLDEESDAADATTAPDAEVQAPADKTRRHAMDDAHAVTEPVADHAATDGSDGGWLFQQRPRDKTAGKPADGDKTGDKPASGKPSSRGEASRGAGILPVSGEDGLTSSSSQPHGTPSAGETPAPRPAGDTAPYVAPAAGGEPGQPGDAESGDGKRRRRRGRRGGRRHRKRQEQLQGQGQVASDQPAALDQPAPAAAPHQAAPGHAVSALSQPPMPPQPPGAPAPKPVPAASKPIHPPRGESKPAATPHGESARKDNPAPAEKPTPAAGQDEPWLALFGGQDPAAKPAATKPAAAEKSRDAGVSPAPRSAVAAPQAAASVSSAPVASDAPAAEPVKKRGRKPREKTAAKNEAIATPSPAAPPAAKGGKSLAAAKPAVETPAPLAEKPAAKRPRRTVKGKASVSEPATAAPVTPAVPAAKSVAMAAPKPVVKRARRAALPTRQDPEYYEEHRREQKQAKKRRPTDEIRDEDDVDFTRE